MNKWLLYFLKDLFKQNTWANVIWVPIDISVGKSVSQNFIYIAFCMHENSVHIPPSLKKKKPLEKFVWSYRVTSDCPVCFNIYKKPLYKLSSQQISQQTSGTAYIYTQVIHSNPRQPIAAYYKLSWNNAWFFFHHFFFFLQMQKLYKNLPFIFQLMCWQSTWIRCNIFSH